MDTFSMMNFLVDSLLPLVTATLLLVISIVVYRENKKKDHINALEQNFDVLQRLNETALDSDKNLIAAVKSVHADDDIDIAEARKIFFAYLRINRLLRAYEYGRIKALPKRDVRRIFTAYAGTLKAYETIIPDLAKRGYPPKFAEDLCDYVKNAEKPPKYQDLLLGLSADSDANFLGMEHDEIAENLLRDIGDPIKTDKERRALLTKLIKHQAASNTDEAKSAATAE